MVSATDNTHYVFAEPGATSRFDVFVRSFPTPALLDWPLQLQADRVEVSNDVTHFQVTVDFREPVEFSVSGRNSETGTLTSTVQIQVEHKRRF